MKKRMFFMLLALMAIICSCNHEPTFNYSYVKQNGLDKGIADSLAGTYEGRLRVVMFDGDEKKFQDENGSWVRVSDKDSVLNYKFTVGGFSDKRLSFPDFPISWVANCFKDKALKEAFAKLPNTTIEVDYDIKGDPVPGIHNAYISFKAHPLVLTFEMNGEEHEAEFIFDDTTVWGINADDRSLWHISNYGIDLAQLTIDGKETYFSQWANNNGESFFFWIDRMKKSILR